jgi:hypothetical protein
MSWYVPEKLKTDFISGYTFYKKCKWSVCPRYRQSFIPQDIEENDLVFLNLDYLDSFVNYLNSNKPKSKFRLITHNSDKDFNFESFQKIKDYCTKIYAINCTFEDKMIKKIPIGINDQSTEVLDNISLKFTEKNELIYMNFRTGHHHSRVDCFNYFSKYDWVTITHENDYLPVRLFYENLSNFKYCISPRGTGIDTHRLYESLLFGVIPIVKKSELDNSYKDLPVIIVDEWKDINYEYLNSEYDNHLSKYNEWLNKNPNWYKTDYWI